MLLMYLKEMSLSIVCYIFTTSVLCHAAFKCMFYHFMLELHVIYQTLVNS